MVVVLAMMGCKKKPNPSVEPEPTFDQKAYILQVGNDLCTLIQPDEQAEAIAILSEVRHHLQGSKVNEQWLDTTIAFQMDNGKACKVVFWGEGKTEEWLMEREAEDHEIINYTIQMPEQLHSAIWVDGQEKMQAVCTQQIVFNHRYCFDLEGTAANLRMNGHVNIVENVADVDLRFFYDAQEVIHWTAQAPTQLPNKPEDMPVNSYFIGLGMAWQMLLEKTGELKSEIEILQEAQILVHVENIGQFYTEYSDWQMTYDKSKGDDLSLQAAHDLRDLVNRHWQMTCYGEGHRLCQLKMNAYEKPDRTGTERYGVEMRLYFEEDQTEYETVEFFTETRYGNIVSKAKYILDTYRNALHKKQ